MTRKNALRSLIKLLGMRLLAIGLGILKGKTSNGGERGDNHDYPS